MPLVSIPAHYDGTQVLLDEEVIAADDDDFGGSGLKVASLIRLGMVATIPGSVILGELGQVSEARLHRLRSRLARQIEAEQGGDGQPATRSESDSEEADKPQRESEGRSR